MKIVHIMMACFYAEGMGYQENILPKKHKELGYDVSIITSPYSPFQEAGKEISECGTYVNKNGIKVTILPFSKWYNTKYYFMKRLSVFMRKYAGLSVLLESISPDIIFIHGLQSLDTLDVARYKKGHSEVKIFVDQHGDFYNMPIARIPDFLVQKVFFASIAKRISNCSEKIWGVTPWRVQYLHEVYRLPLTKTGFLPLGGDERLIDFANQHSIRKEIREKYHISNTDFLVISGGKIDKSKNIHLLIQAVGTINRPNIKLLIFGKPDDEIDAIHEKSPELYTNIVFSDWVSSENIYNLFLASDLGVFPGTHSVLWEQAVSTGLPCLFKHWKGMEHVDVGGNAILLDQPSDDEHYIKMMQETILLLENQNNHELDRMKMVAMSKGIDTFSYIEIAKKSIGLK